MNNYEFINKKDIFLSSLKQNNKISDNTYKSYECDFNKFLQYWNTESDSNFETAANGFIKSLFMQKCLNSTIARRISCFNSFRKFLKRNNIIINYDFKRPFVPKNKPITINSDNITYLISTISDEQIPSKKPLRDKAIIELLYATGVLVSELSNIELKDIDFESKSIVIRKKNGKERNLLFNSQVETAIINYLKNERIEIKNKTEKLFLNYATGPLTPRSIQRICLMFRQFLSKENNKLTPGILRNSYASHMLENGEDLEKVKELLGHKITVSTQRYKNK